MLKGLGKSLDDVYRNTKKGDPPLPSVKLNIINTIKAFLAKRVPFKFTYLHLIQYFMCCVCCRTKRNIRTTPSLRKHAYYDVGEQRLGDELDCVNIIK